MPHATSRSTPKSPVLSSVLTRHGLCWSGSLPSSVARWKQSRSHSANARAHTRGVEGKSRRRRLDASRGPRSGQRQWVVADAQSRRRLAWRSTLATLWPCAAFPRPPWQRAAARTADAGIASPRLVGLARRRSASPRARFRRQPRGQPPARDPASSCELRARYGTHAPRPPSRRTAP
eukprot:7391867-Prymnesium_polylepis.3